MDPPGRQLSSQISNILKLQHRLKQQFLLKESQSIQKNKLRQMIDEQIKQFYSLEVGSNTHEQGQIVEDDGFGDCYNFVKEVLILTSKDSDFLIKVIEKEEDRELASRLIDPIVNVFYENLVEGDEFFKDITKIIIGIQEEQLNGYKLTWIKQKIQQAYLHKPQYKSYVSGVVKNTLLKVIEGQTTFDMPKYMVNSAYESLFNDYDRKRHLDIEGLPSNEIIGKIKFSHKTSIMSEKRMSQSIMSEGQFGSESWLICILEQCIGDIFTSAFRMPIGLRIICKSMQMHMASVVPPVTRQTILSRVWKYLFHMYHDNLAYSQQFVESVHATPQRLSVLEKVRSIFCRLHNIQSQNVQVRRKVFDFVEDVLSLPEERLEKLKSSTGQERLKSYSVCLSFEQMKALFDIILKSQCAKQLNSRIFNRVQRISEMSDQFDFLTSGKSSKGKVLNIQNTYTLFQELSLPPHLQIDFQKLYHETYKNQKLKSILRQILVTLQPIQEYLIGCNVKNFTQLLHRLELYYSNNDEFKGPDRIPIIVKIKYFLWESKQENVQKICSEMIGEYKSRVEGQLELYKDTKIEYLRALQSLKYYLDRAMNRQKSNREKRLREAARKFIGSIKFKYCITSPKSRETEFGTNGRLVVANQQKIIIDSHQSCIHTKGLDKMCDLTKTLHVTSVYEFIRAFCSLEEVRTAIANGQDKSGINASIFWFMSILNDAVAKTPEFHGHLTWFKQYIEDLLTRKIYELIFPRKPTYRDLSIYCRINSFQWLYPSKLGIQKRNNVEQVWQIACKYINDMQKATSTNDKFNSIKQFFRIINGLLFINNEVGNMDSIYPMIVYTLIRARPDRLNSNLNFIELFTQPSKMLSSEGYCFTSLKSAVMYLENLSSQNLIGVSKEEMETNVQQAEIKMGIPFLKRSKSTQYATMNDLRQRLD